MNKYTFVTIFRGGIYIHQVHSADIISAMRIWSVIPDKQIKFLGPESQADLEREIDNDTPSPITGVDNVWFFTVPTRAGMLLVNVIQTI